MAGYISKDELQKQGELMYDPKAECEADATSFVVRMNYINSMQPEELINKINDTYKGYMLEEQYSPLSFKNMVEELAEKATINAIIIPEGSTNGDVIKALFPECVQKEHIKNGYFEMYFDKDLKNDSYMRVQKDWWDAPYKGVK